MAPLVGVVAIIIIMFIWPNWIDAKSKSLHKSLVDGEIDRVEAQLKWVMPLSLWSGKMLMIRSFAAMKKGAFEAALVDMDAAIAKNRGNAWYLCIRGSLHQLMGHYKKALVDYEAALVYSPRYAEAMIGIVRQKTKLGELPQALETANELVENHRASADAYYLRGRLHMLLDHTDEALQDYDRAILMDDGHSDAILGRGVIFLYSGDYSKAREDFNTVIELNPDLFMIRCNLIVVTLDEGQREQAPEDANSLIDQFPKQSYAYQCRALVHLCMENYEAAEEDLSTGYELNPKDDSIPSRRGDLCFVQGQYSEAIKYYKDTLAIAPHEYEALANQALVTYQLGEKEDARRLWKQVLAYDRRYSNADWLKENYRLFELKSEVAQQLCNDMK